jgi:Pilus formation protein N terminal region
MCPRNEVVSMSSRLWLALAFIVAFGAAPAGAQTSSEVLAITLDEAKVAKLPEGTSTLVVGNPMIADVTMLKTGDAMVLTGKGYGETNLIALDSRGAIIFERQLRVLPSKSVLVLQNGGSRVSYSCNPDCMPTVQLGDDPKTFNDAGGEITTRNGFASGGVK